MGLIFLSLSILLLGIALWMQQLVETQEENFEVRSSSQSNGKARLYLEPLKSSDRRYTTGALLVILVGIGLVILVIVTWFLYHFGFILIANNSSRIIWIVLILISSLILLRYGTFYQFKKIVDHEHFEYVGDATLPKKVYVGDSANLSIDLRRVRRLLSGIEETLSSRDKEGGKFITLLIREDATLEVELQAAALVFDSEKKKQEQRVASKQKLSYRWNCYFPNSGKQCITLIFNVLRSSLDNIELGVIEYTIKVVQFASLTQRQVKILSSVLAIAVFVATVIGIVTSFPTLLHIFGSH